MQCFLFPHTHIYQQNREWQWAPRWPPPAQTSSWTLWRDGSSRVSPFNRPSAWKRYIDDILCVWSGSRESLEAFLHRLNSCHPTIHFTWTISTDSVEFLDIRIYKGSRFRETSILDVQTHFKPTNTFQYLHFSSSHPKGVFKGLVKGEAIPFLRSNSSQDNHEKTISTFRHHLLCRRYPKSFVDPLLSPVPNNYIQTLPTPNLNLSSSPDSSLLTPPPQLTFNSTVGPYL